MMLPTPPISTDPSAIHLILACTPEDSRRIAGHAGLTNYAHIPPATGPTGIDHDLRRIHRAIPLMPIGDLYIADNVPPLYPSTTEYLITRFHEWWDDYITPGTERGGCHHVEVPTLDYRYPLVVARSIPRALEIADAHGLEHIITLTRDTRDTATEFNYHGVPTDIYHDDDLDDYTRGLLVEACALATTWWESDEHDGKITKIRRADTPNHSTAVYSTPTLYTEIRPTGELDVSTITPAGINLATITAEEAAQLRDHLVVLTRFGYLPEPSQEYDSL